MRKVWTLLTGAVVIVGFGLGGMGVAPAGAKSSKPVGIDGKVNAKGTKDISSKSSATIEIEADDYYFGPTFVKVAPGEKVTVELKNEGDTTHTFTSDGLKVDKSVSAGRSKTFTLTVPTNGTAFEFHCDFHGEMGMRGAFYTKAGGTAK